MRKPIWWSKGNAGFRNNDQEGRVAAYLRYSYMAMFFQLLNKTFSSLNLAGPRNTKLLVCSYDTDTLSSRTKSLKIVQLTFSNDYTWHNRLSSIINFNLYLNRRSLSFFFFGPSGCLLNLNDQPLVTANINNL